MKLQILLLSYLLLFLAACNKFEIENIATQIDTRKLETHSWTSCKILQNGVNITASSSPIWFNFKSDSTFTGSNATGTISGKWTLSIRTLNLNNSVI